MSSTRDLLLMDLYHSSRDPQALELAARCSPVIYFDDREPFLPLAAGYTIFTQDGPSPSFERIIQLRPDGKPAASIAIEYAIWWDWDIHHLYELEHAWVYLDANGAVVRVEGSWHGKFYDIPVRLEGGHPVLLSEAGKHAFAPDPSWFEERVKNLHRVDSEYISLSAQVLIKPDYVGKIRSRVFDRLLVRSYLQKQAFRPSGSFTQRFSFPAESFVPWAALQEWIPRRVNAWLERLEVSTHPQDYRALRLVSPSDPLPGGLKSAAQAGADLIAMPLSLQNHHLVLGSGPGAPGLEETLPLLQREPMGAFFELPNAEVVDHLAWFLRSNRLGEYVIAASANPALLAQYSAFVTDGMTALQLTDTSPDSLQAAAQARVTFVIPHTPPGLAGIENIHNAGLGIISQPVSTVDALEGFQRLGCDVVWLTM